MIDLPHSNAQRGKLYTITSKYKNTERNQFVFLGIGSLAADSESDSIKPFGVDSITEIDHCSGSFGNRRELSRSLRQFIICRVHFILQGS